MDLHVIKFVFFFPQSMELLEANGEWMHNKYSGTR